MPGPQDLSDIRSVLDYFELLQRGGVINKQHYVSNGVGAGIASFNIVFTAVKANLEDATTQLEYFGTVSSNV
jgi:hypothetical protein